MYGNIVCYLTLYGGTAAYISGTENAFNIFISGNAICHILTYNICSVNYCP